MNKIVLFYYSYIFSLKFKFFDATSNHIPFLLNHETHLYNDRAKLSNANYAYIYIILICPKTKIDELLLVFVCINTVPWDTYIYTRVAIKYENNLMIKFMCSCPVPRLSPSKIVDYHYKYTLMWAFFFIILTHN